MSQGVIIFAFDNPAISYTEMADWNANRIQKHLNLPTTVITNSDRKLQYANTIQVAAPKENGERWFDDLKETVAWQNKNRYNVYELSPYDQTILLDADYVVCSDQLRVVLDIDADILPMGSAYDITGVTDYSHLNSFGATNFNMSWATVLYFKKSCAAQLIFEMIELIQNNWDYYRYLYRIGQSQYRNDFALSIAMNTIYGNTGKWPVLPWRMASIDPIHQLSSQDNQTFKIQFQDNKKLRKHIFVQDTDFHAMGKHHLGDIVASTK